MAKDYIPQNAAQFNAFIKNIIQYVEKKTGGTTPAWTGIPAGRVVMLKDSATLFDAAFNAALATPTPANPDELEHHTMASRTPFTLHFDEAERGKTVYVGLAWQNERGILGAYSEYKTAVVP